MNYAHLAFSAGIVSVLCVPTLPPQWAFILLTMLALICLMIPKINWVGFCILGFMYVCAHAYWYQHHVIPHDLEQKSLKVTGVVTGVPQVNELSTRFQLRIQRWHLDSINQIKTLPINVVLNWYRDAPNIQPGQQWQLTIKLKQPRGLANPGGFDYEKWAMSQHIHAAGYVATGDNHLLQENHVGYHYWRYQIITTLKQKLNQLPQYGMILALITGDRADMDKSDYRILSATGTSHLMAISGLHVGLISGLFYFLLNALWRMWPRYCAEIPAQCIAACGAIVVALVYSAIAGFSTPTLRACIMVTCVMLAQIKRSGSTLSDRILYAFVIILLIDPLVILSVSLWLSFIAVITVIYVNQFKIKHFVFRWLSMHWRVALGLTPVTLLFFQQTSLVSGLANMFAIPWVGFVVLPSAFLGMLLTPLSDLLSQWCFIISAYSLDACWWCLRQMASWSISLWEYPLNHFLQSSLLIFVCILLLAPKYLPGRWLSLCFCLPCIYAPVAQLPIGDVAITTLDVGQGLGMVVRTRHHSLVFDTGPRWLESFDAGEQVVAPYLLQHQLKTIDKLIISHGDLDHIGGLDYLMQHYPVNELISNEDIKMYPQTQHCERGHSWQWDGVQFQFLSPPENYDATRNNRSCVLMIDNGYAKIILTGDIEKKAEQLLQATYQTALEADVLIAPHHGSKTSSSEAFVQVVSPNWVIYPIGYLNRFRFPAKQVVERYQRHGVQQLSTSEQGAITFTLQKPPTPVIWFGYRQFQQKFWRYYPKNQSNP